MAQTFVGSIEVTNAATTPRTAIVLSGDLGTAVVKGPVGAVASTTVAGSFVHIGAKPTTSAAKAPAKRGKSALINPDPGVSTDPGGSTALNSENQPLVWLTVGDSTLPGGVFLSSKAGKRVIGMNGATASIVCGGNGLDGDVYVLDAKGVVRIRLNGHTGDIELTGADCAEEFDAEGDAADMPPGAVMSIAATGAVRPCCEAYDRRVAGIVSGAGRFRPAIVLDKASSSRRRVALGLSGKVYCQVDAGYAPVHTGDLLTASPTMGHAMKVVDLARAVGSIVGKALQPLARGRGLIPVLIALQ